MEVAFEAVDGSLGGMQTLDSEGTFEYSAPVTVVTNPPVNIVEVTITEPPTTDG